MTKSPSSTRAFFILVWGKLRRAYLCFFRMDYVRQGHTHRHGECRRCGRCCFMVFRCPFYYMDGGIPACRIHETKPRVCRLFPIDERDLRDRDLVAPDIPCGYGFDRR
jgi:hypothetical protein